jgi:hypothetical protein
MSEIVEVPRSIAYATSGVRTAAQLAGLMSAIISDLLDGRITPQMANALANTAGKMMKAAELAMKYGTPLDGKKVLQLVD